MVQKKISIVLACSVVFSLQATKERITVLNEFNTPTRIFIDIHPPVVLQKDEIETGYEKHIFTADLLYHRTLYMITDSSAGRIRYEILYNQKKATVALVRDGYLLDEIPYDTSESKLLLRIDANNDVRFIDPLKKRMFRGRQNCC